MSPRLTIVVFKVHYLSGCTSVRNELLGIALICPIDNKASLMTRSHVRPLRIDCGRVDQKKKKGNKDVAVSMHDISRGAPPFLSELKGGAKS